MKKPIVLITSAVLSLVLFTGCSNNASMLESSDSLQEESVESETETKPQHVVELNVVTTYAGDDTNAENYKAAVEAWETATGNIVVDGSRSSNDEFKAKVIDDFQNGMEPDVLFFFTGADANEFIESGQVVSLEEIRAEFPTYGSNMDDAKLPSALNGEKYVIPVNGVWEGLYVNKTVLQEAGVEIPGADYTWAQFLTDCEAIKAAGKTPIAASLGKVPHYWFEFAVENYSGYENHLETPKTAEDLSAQNWISGINDLKDLFDKGYLPANTIYAEESEIFDLFVNGQAAFLLDGSWRMNDIVRSCCSNPEDMTTLDETKLEETFTVTYVPAKELRQATDLVGGCTMGYYITKKAWDDPEKREAAVSFVEAMTTDEIVGRFAGVGAQALKNQPDLDVSQMNALQKDGYLLVKGTTSWVAAVQNCMPEECRTQLLSDIPRVMQWQTNAEGAVQNYVNIIQTMEAEALEKEMQALQESEESNN